MAYKTILVHVDAAPEAEARVRCAAGLADRFNALLLGCGGETLPIVRGDPGALVNGELLVAMSGLVEAHLAQAEASFHRIAGERPHGWTSTRALPDEAIAQAVRGADLIVTSQVDCLRHDPARQEDPGLLVVVTGKPVLIAPPERDYLRGDPVLVCWKDTREANRAIADALPFLQDARRVLVVEVAPKSELDAASARVADVAGMLRRHGVAAESEALPRDQRRTASILLDRARDLGADLVVAGGYGRSRLGEWAFGGVTKALLEQAERFVLLSH